MNEKESLELHAVQLFVDLYNNKNGVGLKFIKLLMPPEADGLCELNGEELGIEVAHIYGAETDATRILGRKLRNALGEKELLANRLYPLDQKIPFALNQVLNNKASKLYNATRVWLIIRNGFPLWFKEDFEQYLERITLPKLHPFEQIWLICDSTGKSGLLKLYSRA